MFLSTNKGESWSAVNTGLPSVNLASIAVLGTNLFAGTKKGVWRRPLTEVIGIQNISTEIPSEYRLSQNYPNPFNPMTNIGLRIANFGFVSLKVYDISGKKLQYW